jgi:hypothetical protein
MLDGWALEPTRTLTLRDIHSQVANALSKGKILRLECAPTLPRKMKFVKTSILSHASIVCCTCVQNNKKDSEGGFVYLVRKRRYRPAAHDRGILKGKFSLAGKTKWQKRVLCFNNKISKLMLFINNHFYILLSSLNLSQDSFSVAKTAAEIILISVLAS